jgi:thioredoxin 1
MAIIEVDEENFSQEMSNAFKKKDIVVVKFGSEYCEPCHALECELEELDETFDNISILMIDTTESSSLAEQYEIYELPTMLIYKENDKILFRHAGVMLAQDIEKIIKEK